MIARQVSALRISRTSLVLTLKRHLPPFAMWPAFPTSDYYEGSVAIGLAPVGDLMFPNVSCNSVM